MGGVGAGRLFLNISYRLTVDGNITARGGKWRSVQAGGGSGGSIYIRTWILDGEGNVDVSGGEGYGGDYSAHGGGGGGGRVALYYVHDFYAGEYFYS